MLFPGFDKLPVAKNTNATFFEFEEVIVYFYDLIEVWNPQGS